MPVSKLSAASWSPYADLSDLMSALEKAIASHASKSKSKTSSEPMCRVLSDGDFESWLSTSSNLRNSSLSNYQELILATSGVQLSSLIFSKSGTALFDEVCRRVDVNARYATLLPQWSDVADQLGVDELQQQWVYSAVRPKESFTRAMLEIYMGRQGTLGHVLQALYDLECFEILEKLSPSVRLFLRESQMLTKTSRPDDNYFSALATVIKAFNPKSDPCSSMRNLLSQNNVFRNDDTPVIVHHSSLNFDPKDGLFGSKLDGIDGLLDDNDKIDEALFGSSFDLNKHGNDCLLDQVKAKSEKLCRVLLLFASDGVRDAEAFYNRFQGHQHAGVQLELFRLTESRLWYPLLSSPEACCQKWTNEVDYIVPFLTPNFLADVHNGSNDNSDCGLVPTSPFINRYIYCLLRARFTEDKCINHRVRPIVPQFCLQEVSQCSAVKREPLFRLVWVAANSNQLEGRLESMMKLCAKRNQ